LNKLNEVFACTHAVVSRMQLFANKHEAKCSLLILRLFLPILYITLIANISS